MMEQIYCGVDVSKARGEVVLSRAAAPKAGADEWDLPVDRAPATWTLDATVAGVSAKYVTGDTVKMTDLEITAAVFADEPRLGDGLTVDGQPLTILQIMPLPAGGTKVAWTILARG
jgi:hypothetical protein